MDLNSYGGYLIRSKFAVLLNQSWLNAKRIGKNIRDLPDQNAIKLVYLLCVWRRNLVGQGNLIFCLGSKGRAISTLQFLRAKMAAVQKIDHRHLKRIGRRGPIPVNDSTADI